MDYKETRIQGYKNLLKYLDQYKIKECVLEIDEKEIFNSNLIVSRIGKSTYLVEERLEV